MQPQQQQVETYSPYATYEEEQYRAYLLERYILMSDLKVSLRKSFNQGQANRDDHHNLISVTLELWEQLYPNIMDTELEEKFKKFLPFWMSQGRLFLEERYEQFLWYLCFLINVAFEKLGFKNIKT